MLTFKVAENKKGLFLKFTILVREDLQCKITKHFNVQGNHGFCDVVSSHSIRRIWKPFMLVQKEILSSVSQDYVIYMIVFQQTSQCPFKFEEIKCVKSLLKLIREWNSLTSEKLTTQTYKHMHTQTHILFFSDFSLLFWMPSYIILSV